MSGAFARGRKAWGICGRSGARALLNDLVFDGRYPNMRVLPDWWEGRHPSEMQKDIRDSIALYRPAPELGVPSAPVLEAVQSGLDGELSWDASTVGDAQIASYRVYRRTADETESTFIATLELSYDEYREITDEPLSYTDEGLTVGVTYIWNVEAVDTKGRGAQSNSATLTMEAG